MKSNYYEVKLYYAIDSQNHFYGVAAAEDKNAAIITVLRNLERNENFRENFPMGIASAERIDVDEISREKYYDELALSHAERIGVYEYAVHGSKMQYISYYGSEGFVKVVYDLITGNEIRTSQATTKRAYNYFVG